MAQNSGLKLNEKGSSSMTILGMILVHLGVIILTFEVLTPRGVTRFYDYSPLV
jgi:hypothetical protein